MGKAKYFIAFSLIASAALSGVAWAAPNNAQNNPQIVANYQSGDHGIVNEPFLHQGSDVVKKNGDSGNFQQWFYGTSEEPDGTHGDHSLWMSVGSSTECPNSSWTLVTNASASWGDYLLSGNYCVHTNDYHPTK